MAGRIYLLDGDSRLIAMEESLYRDGRINGAPGVDPVQSGPTGRVHGTYAAPGSIAGPPGSISRCGFSMGTLAITRRRPHDHDP
jgi:hypothetical protein